MGPPTPGTWHEVFAVFLRLGLTSFGGPVAHLAYFREEFVVRRGWIDEGAYAELVSLCQFLPGPASSQAGIALGHLRAGLPGALMAWLGFTLPSALLMTVFALGLLERGPAQVGWLSGLKVFAVAIVAQAVWGMARALCPDAARRGIAVAAAGVLLVVPWPQAQFGVMVGAGFLGWLLLRGLPIPSSKALFAPVPRGTAIAALALYAILLVGLPVAARVVHADILELFAVFYRAGALVFGGGHVVLPLLQAEVVPPGWVSEQTFLAGYGAAQAVPGPLFTFAAFLGASMNEAPTGWTGGAIALVAIFVPGFLLVVGALPFWEALRRSARMQAALAGINAAVVGLLFAALCTPVWTSAIRGPGDAALAAVALLALMRWKLPPWLVVAGCGAAGGLWSLLS